MKPISHPLACYMAAEFIDKWSTKLSTSEALAMVLLNKEHVTQQEVITLRDHPLVHTLDNTFGGDRRKAHPHTWLVKDPDMANLKIRRQVRVLMLCFLAAMLENQ